jgi:O-6-methylguanine DNA methyltransferase
MPTATFPTAIGDCTLSWDTAGLTGFAFPAPAAYLAAERSDPCNASTRSVARERNDPRSAVSSVSPPQSALCRQSSVVCPPPISALIARIQRHLAGNLQDFADLAYDWSRVTAFQSRVLRSVLAIKPGRTATYGELARALGAKPGAARAIGGAVGANPWPLLVPCHRILGAGGRLTGYSAPGGLATKTQLLALEGVELMG